MAKGIYPRTPSMKTGKFVRTELHRQKMSEAHKGKVPWNKGKTGLYSPSLETRKKISEGHKLRGVGKWMKFKTGELSPRWKGGFPNCLDCGKKLAIRHPKFGKCRKCIAPMFQGPGNGHWKGDAVKYAGLHAWVRSRLGQPNKCNNCGTEIANVYEWANKSGKYLRDLSDWERLCVTCHRRKDGNGIKAWITRRKNLIV